MEKLSQLMDGELGSRECKNQIVRLEQDPLLVQGWETYHMIRDAIRHDEVEFGADFARRLHERLAQEATVIAPHTRLRYQVARYTLPLAAGVAGVALVAWLAVSLQHSGQQGQLVAQAPAPAAPALSTAQAVPMDGRVSEYLTVHQEFSPRTALQGVGSYVRTVSAADGSGR